MTARPCRQRHALLPGRVVRPGAAAPFAFWAGAAVAVALALGGCAQRPPVPDWQPKADTAMNRTLAAYLNGDDSADAQEFERARREISRTGRPELLARAELMRCAAQVASLDLVPCAGFERLRLDAAGPEQAYAAYLAGQIAPAQVAALPEQHRAVAASASSAAALAIDDPLARLVAAGVLLRRGGADPALIEMAIDTASAQGWRRPLRAWLGLQLVRAEQAGAAEAVARLRRRIALLDGPPTGTAR